MAFTYRIVDIYRELAEERIHNRNIKETDSDASVARMCFSKFESLLKSESLNAELRRNVKKMLRDIGKVVGSINDRPLKLFVGFAVEYIQSRIIEVPRYIYVPWSAENAPELVNWAKAWKTFAQGQGKAFDVISKGTGQKPFSNIDPLSQIYVLGHGAPGCQSLVKAAQQIPPSGLSQIQMAAKVKELWDPIDFTILAPNLKSEGLPEAFAGSLKIYACSGGVNGSGTINALVPRSLQGTSFVNLFAQHMRRLGYKDCEIVGYERDLAAPTAFELTGARTVAVSADAKQGLAELVKADARIALLSAAMEGKAVSDAELIQLYNQFYQNRLRRLTLPKASTVAKRF